MGSVLALLAVEGIEGLALLAGEGAAAAAAAEGAAIAMDSMITLEGFSAAEAGVILGLDGGLELAEAGGAGITGGATGIRLGLGGGLAFSAGVAASLGLLIEGVQGASISPVGGSGQADYGNQTIPQYTETFLNPDMWAVLGELKHLLFEAFSANPEDAIIAESQSTRLGRDAQGVPHLVFLDGEDQIKGAFDLRTSKVLTGPLANARGVRPTQGPVNSSRRPLANPGLPQLPPPEQGFKLPEDPTEEEVEELLRENYSDSNYHFMVEQYGFPLPGLTGTETLVLSIADLITAHSSRGRTTQTSRKKTRKRKRDE